jgi:hypothetical protein
MFKEYYEMKTLLKICIRQFLQKRTTYFTVSVILKQYLNIKENVSHNSYLLYKCGMYDISHARKSLLFFLSDQ